jgi:hypothetical protein
MAYVDETPEKCYDNLREAIFLHRFCPDFLTARSFSTDRRFD